MSDSGAWMGLAGARGTGAGVGDPEPAVPTIFDSHTHLDAMAQKAGVAASSEFVAGVMDEARAVGVVRAITVGDTMGSSRWCVGAARQHPDVYAAVAVHPTEIAGITEDDYAELEALARDPRVVAVGETGLDYYWDRTAPADQQREFRRHIALAKAVGKPLMIHDRDAHADVLRILREEGAPEQVVFHAFSGDAEMARACVAAGYVLSFAGVVTFKNAPALRAAAAVTPAEHLLVETDAPFLTPHPFRGRPNAPRLLPLTVAGLAAAAGLEIEALCAAVSATGSRIFGLPTP
ncbi:TatD family hydrolase [Jatrophihabitans sp.]|uniref:TatD family hydrolase n=1 Tax=Jatrophihabitans sp. TaxID=1932789 RepID=UPI0030C6F5B3|nr:TatD DNase family protein [Jatrophihabitans sp.]